MNSTILQHVPSTAALRALSRLCRTNRAHGKEYCSMAARPTRTAKCRQQIPIQRRILPSSSRCKTTLADAPEPQTFANDPTRYDPQNRTGPEPTNQGTTDPQHQASQTTLPDITSYYTLFPQTLPNGPPSQRSQPTTTSSTTHTNPQSQGQNQDQTQTAIPKFHIPPRVLRQEFLHLQTLHHPDKHPPSTPSHKQAYALSTLLNTAYLTLSDPLLRSQYLLQTQYNIDVTNEDNSAHPTDADTLSIVMDAQEELETATEQNAESTVERLREENSARIRETEQKVGEAFERGDGEGARVETVRLKYWRSLDGALREWEVGKEVRLMH